MAVRLISRGRLEEALDLLNETIRQDPRFAPSYENRAAVFEALGLHPQAEADRRRAADLRAAQPPPPQPEMAAASPEEPAPPGETAGEEATLEAEADEVREPEAAASSEDGEAAAPAAAEPVPEESPPPVMPSYRARPRPSIGGALLRAAGVILFALGLFAAGGVGVYLALEATSGDDEDSPPGATASPAPADATDGNEDGEAGGADTDDTDGGGTNGAGSGEATVEEALEGSPYSFSHLEDAWHAKALAVVVGDISESVTGFGEPAVDVTLTGGGAAMELSVLTYESADAKDEEWTLGASPEPKIGAVLPAGASVWYNANAVVVVRVPSESLRQDALDGFLSLGESAEEQTDEE